MILPIVNYGHPALRQKGALIDQFDDSLETFVDDMLDTMYDADGVGLAAQQVGKALQITVIDVSHAEDRPSTMAIDGKEVDIKDYMPLVLINPDVKPLNEMVKGPEGCLSFPEVYADIERPESVEVKAQDHKGTHYTFTCGGLLAKAVQHELDHLKGILFIDRMERKDKDKWRGVLDAMRIETQKELSSNK
jgi:peptide deformylase